MLKVNIVGGLMKNLIFGAWCSQKTNIQGGIAWKERVAQFADLSGTCQKIEGDF